MKRIRLKTSPVVARFGSTSAARTKVLDRTAGYTGTGECIHYVSVISEQPGDVFAPVRRKGSPDGLENLPDLTGNVGFVATRLPSFSMVDPLEER